MAIGGERHFGKVTSKHWTKFAQQANFDENRLRETVKYMAEKIPTLLHTVYEEEQALLYESELTHRLLPKVEHHCEATLTMLERDY